MRFVLGATTRVMVAIAGLVVAALVLGLASVLMGVAGAGQSRAAASLRPVVSAAFAHALRPGSWRAGQAPSTTGPNGGLIATSCTGSAACTAVGEHQASGSTVVPLAEAWNGTSWRIQATPNPTGG